MQSILIVLIVLLNGNFADGLNHWQAAPQWSAKNGTAQLAADHRAGTGTLPANLCSDLYAVTARQGVAGGGDVHVSSRYGAGYIYAGVQWYDRNRALLGSEMLATSEGRERTTARLTFHTRAPDAARFVSLCFFGGTYGGKILRATVDNAFLK